MSDNIIIRKANESDLEDILALINSPDADDGTAMELRDANTVYQSILDDSNYFLIVASTEDGIIAIITLTIIMQMTHEGSTTAYITDLIISENILEKTTLANDLIGYTKELAEEYGCYKIVFHNDYHHELIDSSSQELGLEKGVSSFNLPI
ncbi:MAG: GNAT family N-acetyltransferase [Gammaproteobacteria bacterium]|nr:GNAT family N-acetyltransferase [Gammaproteobacteria bacterium]